jgi:hypothetical protein
MTRLEAIRARLKEQSPYYAYMTETTSRAHDDIAALLAVVEAAKIYVANPLRVVPSVGDWGNKLIAALAALDQEETP